MVASLKCSARETKREDKEYKKGIVGMEEGSRTGYKSAMEKLLLRSEEQSLELLSRFVDDLVERYPAFRVLQGSISAVLSEAVNNAIVHGNKRDPNKKITCSYEVKDSVACFRVEDEGEGFEYTSVPNPLLFENIEKPHGRGLFIIRMLSDRLTFEDEGRVLLIEFDSSKSERILNGTKNAN